LFFAYGSLSEPYLQNIIAFIGLGASFVLWMHSWAARRDARSGRYYLLKILDYSVAREVDQIQKWRGIGFPKWFYHPVTRLASYFQALVAGAWVLILAHSLAGVSIPTLEGLGLGAFAVAAELAIIDRHEDRKTYSEQDYR
jgi:hypothetical protein